MDEFHRIDHERRLYVLKCNGGYTCLGFDVADRRARAVAAWCDCEPPKAEPGTDLHYREYETIMAAGRSHFKRTGRRCEAELEPALIGLEGCRVEVTTPEGERRRFWVGKSGGWCPCHLEVARSNSIGGPAVSLAPGSTVHVVRRPGQSRSRRGS